MRKKILVLAGVIAVLAVVLSVTVFAKEEAAEAALTNYNFITVLYKELVMFLNATFKAVDAIYVFFRDLFA